VREYAELEAFLKNAPTYLMTMTMTMTMTMPDIDKCFTNKLKGIFLEYYRRGEGFPDFKLSTKGFNMAPQTLRRKLKTENTNYKEIKDAIRRDLAIGKLMHENLPVADIAVQLGFLEPASFARAFKQWTGLSPAKYRSSLQL